MSAKIYSVILAVVFMAKIFILFQVYRCQSVSKQFSTCMQDVKKHSKNILFRIGLPFFQIHLVVLVDLTVYLTGRSLVELTAVYNTLWHKHLSFTIFRTIFVRYQVKYVIKILTNQAFIIKNSDS